MPLQLLRKKIPNHFAPTKMAKIKQIITSVGSMWKNRNLFHCWCECKMVQPFLKAVWQFFKRLNIELPYDPAISLPRK